MSVEKFEFSNWFTCENRVYWPNCKLFFNYIINFNHATCIFPHIASFSHRFKLVTLWPIQTKWSQFKCKNYLKLMDKLFAADSYDKYISRRKRTKVHSILLEIFIEWFRLCKVVPEAAQEMYMYLIIEYIIFQMVFCSFLFPHLFDIENQWKNTLR